MADINHLRLSLFLMRISVALVLFVWTIDKFVNPSHAIEVYDHFYFIPAVPVHIMYIIGGLEMILIVCFLMGIKKGMSYMLVLVIHGVSTISSYKMYINPFEGPALLFFAAWPMLAACFMLYNLRGSDTMFSFNIR